LRARPDAVQLPQAQIQRESAPDGEPLARYQQLVGRHWAEKRQSAEALFDEHRDSVFGSRALAALCLMTDPLSDIARRLANHLNDGQQYRLANELYAKLYQAGTMSHGTLLAYASSYSEANPHLAGADHAITLAEEALKRVEQRFGNAPSSDEAVAAFAECHRRLGGLRQWRWRLSRSNEDLERAIVALSEALRINDRARSGCSNTRGFLPSRGSSRWYCCGFAIRA
jgi:hypothetical protein